MDELERAGAWSGVPTEDEAARDRQLEFGAFPRDTGEPSGHLMHVVSLVVPLLRFGSIDFTWYRARFEMSERQFMRDLQHLRKIGEGPGIRVSKQRAGRVVLESIDGKNRLGKMEHVREDALHAIAVALGAPAARELEADELGEDRTDRFLLFALPRLIDGTRAADVFEAFKVAHERCARMRFRYRDARRAVTMRSVEPYRVPAHGGRYYLTAFDIAPRKGWRYFALDAIVTDPAPAGTFVRRSIPREYLACDAVGMLQRGLPEIDVTVRLSSVVAASVTSRRWQRAQRITQHADGSADVTFTVNDVDEVVRWALGFGSESSVIAPPRAVAAAKRTIAALSLRYSVVEAAEQGLAATR